MSDQDGESKTVGFYILNGGLCNREFVTPQDFHRILRATGIPSYAEISTDINERSYRFDSVGSNSREGVLADISFTDGKSPQRERFLLSQVIAHKERPYAPFSSSPHK